MWREFKAFLIKENVLALAIAVVIGGALSKLVAAFVADFIMPIVGRLTPAGEWRAFAWEVGGMRFLIGDFVSVLLDFLIIGFVAWRMTKLFMRPQAPAATATKECPHCRQSIDARATRCSHCTSQLSGAAA